MVMSASHAELKFSAQILGEQKAKCQALFFRRRNPQNHPPAFPLGRTGISPNGR
jgi:hypothetical protein